SCCKPAYGRSTSPSTPVALTIRKSEADLISCSSSADLPMPGSPCTKSVPLPPFRTASSTCSSDASSRSRPTSSRARPPVGGLVESPPLLGPVCRWFIFRSREEFPRYPAVRVRSRVLAAIQERPDVVGEQLGVLVEEAVPGVGI